MDGIAALMLRDLAILLVIILVTIAAAIFGGLYWGTTASALILAVGLVVAILFLRPRRLGPSQDKPR